MSARRSCSTASPWVRPTPAEMTRSASSATILLDVDAVEPGDDRDVRRLGREVGDVLDLADDAVAGADREQDLGRGGRQRDDLLGFGGDRDLGAFVVGQGHREAAGRARATGRRMAARWPAGPMRRGCADSRPPGPQAAAIRAIRTSGSRKRRAAMEVSGVVRGRPGARDGAPRDVGEGCLSRSVASWCLPFLSKVEQPLRVGDRTSIGPGGWAIDGHRSGTVPDSHRLRGPAACRLQTAREA